MRISDWSSDVCSSDLPSNGTRAGADVSVAAVVGVVAAVSSGAGVVGVVAVVVVVVAAPVASSADGPSEGSAGSSAPCSRNATPPSATRARATPSRIRATRWSMCTATWWHGRSEEHTSELQSLMRLSYAVFCLNKKNTRTIYIDRQTISHNKHN